MKANKTIGFLCRNLNISSTFLLNRKAKSINLKLSNVELRGSLPPDSETHLVLITCYNDWIEDRHKDARLAMIYNIANINFAIADRETLKPPLVQ